MADDFSGLVKHDLDEMRLDVEEVEVKEEEVHSERRSEKVEIDGGAREETDGNMEGDMQSTVHYVTRDPSPSLSSSRGSSLDVPSRSQNSTTSSSSSTSSSEIPSSLENFRTPTIDYNRDNESQRLVAMIGREFDEPTKTADELQKLSPRQDHSVTPVMKLVPFTIARGILRKCKFDWRGLRHYDLVCLCYNASEARILLTGIDGFYTVLLRNLEALMGTCCVTSVPVDGAQVHTC